MPDLSYRKRHYGPTCLPYDSLHRDLQVLCLHEQGSLAASADSSIETVATIVPRREHGVYRVCRSLRITRLVVDQ